MTTYPLVGVVGVTLPLEIWEISDNVLEMMQDRDIVTVGGKVED